MSKRILYVSDLDGTLLKNDKSISKYSAQVINSLIDKGVLFTYATARSAYTAKEVTRGINIKSPVILYNGTFIVDLSTNEVLYSNAFEGDEARELVRLLERDGISPLVYAFLNGEEKFSYDKSKLTRGIRAFMDDHPSDPRVNPTSSEKLTQGELFHITCIDKRERLLTHYERLKEKFCCVLYKDQYTREWWLEIMPRGATKANAVKKLAELLSADETVCFGDGANDVSMLAEADFSYATENAHEELKKIATAIIDSNENDGVAKWLSENGGNI